MCLFVIDRCCQSIEWRRRRTKWPRLDAPKLDDTNNYVDLDSVRDFYGPNNVAKVIVISRERNGARNETKIIHSECAWYY